MNIIQNKVSGRNAASSEAHFTMGGFLVTLIILASNLKYPCNMARR